MKKEVFFFFFVFSSFADGNTYNHTRYVLGRKGVNVSDGLSCRFNHPRGVGARDRRHKLKLEDRLNDRARYGQAKDGA